MDFEAWSEICPFPEQKEIYTHPFSSPHFHCYFRRLHYPVGQLQEAHMALVSAAVAGSQSAFASPPSRTPLQAAQRSEGLRANDGHAHYPLLAALYSRRTQSASSDQSLEWDN